MCQMSCQFFLVYSKVGRYLLPKVSLSLDISYNMISQKVQKNSEKKRKSVYVQMVVT